VVGACSSSPLRRLATALFAAGVFAVALAATGTSRAQTPPAQLPQGPAAKSPVLEPESIAALKRMGQYLVSLRSFEIMATISIEYVLDNNQKILIDGTSRYRVRRPDRLRIDLSTDVLERVFQYDGKDLVVTAPKEKFFARLEAKPTVRETLAWAAQTFGIEVPLADLFDWGTADAPEGDIREGFIVGKSRVGGVDCEHWAFRQADADWEIWIRTGDAPLPLKLSIVNTADPALPRYEAVLSWTPGSEFPDELFTQSPVPDAKRIDFLPLAPGPRQQR
jgi:hypothetical protein